MASRKDGLMPRYWSTEVPASKSAAETAELIREHGASSITAHYSAGGEPSGISFVMEVPDLGLVPVHLMAESEALERRLRNAGRSLKSSYATQARRVAWRQLKGLVELQLETVANGVKPFHSMFLADIMREDGQTIGDWIGQEHQIPGVAPLMLTGGGR